MATHGKKTVDLMTPVLMEFAKAVYICQIFESSLCLLLALMAHEKAPSEDEIFEAAWDFHSKKTVGQLLRSLRQKIEVPPDVDRYLGEGVDFRNKIIHGFLTKNALRLADPIGRIDIEREIKHLKIEVKKRDILVNKLIDALLAKYGLSNAILKRNADRYWDYLNPHEDDAEKALRH